MRGVWRLRHYRNKVRDNVRFVTGTYLHLRNGTALLRGLIRELREKSNAQNPTLHFRNGVQIELGQGAYQAYRYLFSEIFLDRCYQPTSDFVPRSGWTVVDLGANVGFFTCQASKAASGVRVVAVEALAVYADLLRRNVERSGLRDVQIIQAAVSGRAKVDIPLRLWYTRSGEAAMTANPPAPGSKVEFVTVPSITLSEVFDTAHIERCDLLKIDIEGAEYDVIDGTPGDVWQRVHRIVMETHKVDGRNESEVKEAFRKHGFRVASNGHLLWATRQGAS